MSSSVALRLALELYHVPSRLRTARMQPLPDDVADVLAIAADGEPARVAAAAHVERSPEVIERAVAFFIEQVLLHPESDSYKILGARPEASTADLRRNMALLLRWLHPDLDRTGARSMFTPRVLAAWEDLKSPERRSAYDARLAALQKPARRKTAAERQHADRQRMRAVGQGAWKGPPPLHRAFLSRMLGLLRGGRA